MATNIVASLIEASALAGFAVTIITPPGYQPADEIVERARTISTGPLQVTLTTELAKLDVATAIYTDVWVSMGHETRWKPGVRHLRPTRSTRL